MKKEKDTMKIEILEGNSEVQIESRIGKVILFKSALVGDLLQRKDGRIFRVCEEVTFEKDKADKSKNFSVAVLYSYSRYSLDPFRWLDPKEELPPEYYQEWHNWRVDSNCEKYTVIGESKNCLKSILPWDTCYRLLKMGIYYVEDLNYHIKTFGFEDILSQRRISGKRKTMITNDLLDAGFELNLKQS